MTDEHEHESRDGRKRRRQSSATPLQAREASDANPPARNTKIIKTDDSPSPSPQPLSRPENNRRRSEHIIDETFRGRPRALRTPSNASGQESVAEDRRRSPAPSRGPRLERSTSNDGYRRRGSLPNSSRRYHGQPDNAYEPGRRQRMSLADVGRVFSDSVFADRVGYQSLIKKVDEEGTGTGKLVDEKLEMGLKLREWDAKTSK